MNARSRARTSASWPATRWRWIRSGGSARVATTSRSCFGACEISDPSSFSTTGFSISCRSSRTRTTLAARGQPADDPLHGIVDPVAARHPKRPSTPSSASSTRLPEVGAPVVVAVDRQPRDVAAPGRPRREQGGLPRPRVRGDQRQRLLDRAGQELVEPCASDEARRPRWGDQLRPVDANRRFAAGRSATSRGLDRLHDLRPFSLSDQRDCHPQRVSARPLHLIDTRKAPSPTRGEDAGPLVARPSKRDRRHPFARPDARRPHPRFPRCPVPDRQPARRVHPVPGTRHADRPRSRRPC